MLNIIDKKTPNFTPGRQSWQPDIIVNHITDGHFPGSINWVMNPQSRVSYHFMVSHSGAVYQLVNLVDTAWANGTTTNGANNDNKHSLLELVRTRNVNANLYTISIGYEGRHAITRGALSPKQMEAGISLIAHIRDEVRRIWDIHIPFENIVGHRDIAPIWRSHCPGAKFPLYEMIQQLQIRDDIACMGKNNNVPAVTERNGQTGRAEPDGWAADAWAWAIKELRMDGTRPRDSMTRQEAMVLMKRLHGLTRTETRLIGSREQVS